MTKSVLVGINGEDDQLPSLANKVGCDICAWPLLYLSMPLGDNPHRMGFWEPVIERISKKLVGWLKGCHSRGDRLTLI